MTLATRRTRIRARNRTRVFIPALLLAALILAALAQVEAMLAPTPAGPCDGLASGYLAACEDAERAIDDRERFGG